MKNPYVGQDWCDLWEHFDHHGLPYDTLHAAALVEKYLRIYDFYQKLNTVVAWRDGRIYWVRHSGGKRLI